MSELVPIDGREEARRYRRDRALFLILVVLILGPAALYAWGAVGTARQIARRDALQGNVATAELGGRLIDAQCTTGLAVLRSLAERPLLIAAMRHGAPRPASASGSPLAGDRRAIERYLRDAVELVPDISLVAAYSPEGEWVASYPAMTAPARSAAREPWFQQCRRAPAPSVSSRCFRADRDDTSAISLVIPVGPRQRPAGYLVAPFRLKEISRWLRPLRLGAGSVLYVADAAGRVVVCSGGRSYRQADLHQYAPVRLALAGQQGATDAPSPLLRTTALVGYAPARVPGWAVVAAQSETAALAPADQLLQRFLLLMLPILGLIGAAGWSLERLHGRQLNLARENAALSRELARQNDGLRAADQAKSDFLANVSHDLRTPIASLKASVSGLLDPEIEWDHALLRGFLILVHEEIDRLAAQVRNLLDMSRIEAGVLIPQRATCDLAEIAASALERVAPLAGGWQIETRWAPEPLLIEADYVQIETVILNFLENAIKYSAPGTTLLLRAETGRSGSGRPLPDRAGAREAVRADDCVLFALRDEGPGVNPAEAAQIFEKFHRGAAGPRARGTGLGLAICRAVVEAHAGSIGVCPAPGGGAEFWFALPRLQSPLAVAGVGRTE